MTETIEDFDELFDDLDVGEFEERTRRPRPRPRVPTPSSRSSFQARQAPTAASQSQVQAAARNLDSKIETLSKAVKALEVRSASLSAEQSRTAAALAKEIAERKKSTDGVRGDLQQTKMLSVLLPMLTQGKTVAGEDENGRPVNYVTESNSKISQFLPLMLLMGGTTSEPGKGGLDTNMLLLFAVLSDKDK